MDDDMLVVAWALIAGLVRLEAGESERLNVVLLGVARFDPEGYNCDEGSKKNK